MNDNRKNINSGNIDDVLGIFENNPTYNKRREDLTNEQIRVQTYEQNRNRQMKRNAERRAQMDKQIMEYQKASSKSIGNKKKTKDINRRKKSNISFDKLQERVAITLCVFASVVALAIPVGIKVAPLIKEQISFSQNVEKGTDLLVARAFNELTLNDLAGFSIEDGTFVVKENSIDDYKKLDITSHLDVYIYRLILPESEFDKFIRSVSYKDGLHRYTSMYQFLNVNGYYTEGTNSPSLEVFANMMENRINNLYSSLYSGYTDDDGVYSASDYLEDEAKGKGGK